MPLSPQGEPKTGYIMTLYRRLAGNHLPATLAILAAFGIAGVATVSVITANQIDQISLEVQTSFIKKGINDEVRSVPREQESVTVWDEAVIRIESGDFHWLSAHLGQFLHSGHGHDRTYVINPKGELVNAMRDGSIITPPAFHGEQAVVEDAAQDLREQLDTAFAGERGAPGRRLIFASQVTHIDGRPAMVSVKPIVPSTLRVSVPRGEEYLLASVKFLDGKVVREIASTARIPHVQYAEVPPANGAYVPLLDSNSREIGYYVWPPRRPGNELLMKIAPWAAGICLLGFGISAFLLRRLRRTRDELQDTQVRSEHMSLHDSLTGLANRIKFEGRTERAFEKAHETAGEVVIITLDLDRFQTVNDTLGPKIADQLLVAAAGRLVALSGPASSVARMSGDEFAVLVEGENALSVAEQLVRSIVEAFDVPFVIGNEKIRIGMSAGMAVHKAGAPADTQELLRKADLALFESKKRGRSCYTIFSSNMDEIVKQRRSIERDLGVAVGSRGDLILSYQPLYDGDGRVAGAEALLRWNHPIHKGISPTLIVGIAEEAGLIGDLGDWVLKEACRMVSEVKIPWIAINISAAQLRSPTFANECLETIRKMRVDPRQIQVEVTEAAILDYPEDAVPTLKRLREAGVKVTIDDFGTRLSSMDLLKDFPVDRVKIARSFVKAISAGREGTAVVAAMMDMARACGLDVTAKGVETAEQRDALKNLGCSEMQGFLLSRPLETGQFMMMFEAYSFGVARK